MTRIAVVVIGDEILIGRTVDTNSARIARLLSDHGFSLERIFTIPDVPAVLRSTFDAAFEAADVVLTTGGLGATSDDYTRKTLCEYFGGELVVHEPTEQKIRMFFEMRGKPVNELTLTNAYIPSSCTPLDNQVGVAPGMRFTRPDGKELFAMPGVPHEMGHLMQEQVMPILLQTRKTDHFRRRTFRFMGLTESHLAQTMRAVEAGLAQTMKIAYNPSFRSLDLRLTLACPPDEAAAGNAAFEQGCAAIESAAAEWLYGYDEDTLSAVVGRLLREKGLQAATAESCTGGALSAMIVAEAGASDYFLGSVGAYANAVKMNVLGVAPETLEAHGAVSEQTAIEMAVGARRVLGAHVALSTTGVAGPAGGSDGKPVGLVWIGYADAEKAYAKSFRFERDRARNIERSAVTALNILRLELLGLPVRN